MDKFHIDTYILKHFICGYKVILIIGFLVYFKDVICNKLMVTKENKL